MQLHPDVISAANDAFQLSVLNNLQYPPWNYNSTNVSVSVVDVFYDNFNNKLKHNSDHAYICNIV